MGALWSGVDWNKTLNKYYAENVKISRDETKHAVKVVIPIVEKILRELNNQDPRFDCQPLHAGSYSQGLKVKQANEFDVNVKLCGINALSWEDLTSKKSRTYKFSDSPVVGDPCSTFPEAREIVRPDWSFWHLFSSPSLPEPPVGCCFVSLERCGSSLWVDKSDMVFDNDVVPYLVKKKFKDLLAGAITKLNLRENGLVRKAKPHGPALTIRISSPESPHGIDVDFAPVIEANLNVPPRLGWPRRNCRWPSSEKITKMKNIGINLVAKRNFYWMLSFGRMEKELVDRIDDDGGCRKQVHRITKRMLSDIWCPTTKPVISSYHLKNALFWECEENPRSSDWQNEQLGVRFLGVVKRIRDAITQRHLALYFYPDVNLLLEKNSEELDLVGKNVDKFLKDPMRHILVNGDITSNM